MRALIAATAGVLVGLELLEAALAARIDRRRRLHRSNHHPSNPRRNTP